MYPYFLSKTLATTALRRHVAVGASRARVVQRKQRSDACASEVGWASTVIVRVRTCSSRAHAGNAMVVANGNDSSQRLSSIQIVHTAARRAIMTREIVRLCVNKNIFACLDLSTPLHPLLESAVWLVGAWETTTHTNEHFPTPFATRGGYKQRLEIKVNNVPMFDRPPLNVRYDVDNVISWKKVLFTRRSAPFRVASPPKTGFV